MPIDASIYQGYGNTSLEGGLADALNNYQDRQNRLAQLAQQQELGGLQLQKAKQEAEQYPAQLAAQKQAKEAQYMQSVSREIAQNPDNADAILQKHAEIAPKVGIDPAHITWLASDLMSNSKSIDDLRTRAMYHANPQEYEKEALKAQFATTKPTESQLSKIDQKDFTPESFKNFLQSGSTDRSLLVVAPKEKADKGMTQSQSLDFEEKLSSKHAQQSKDFIAGRDAYTQLKSTLGGANASPASTLAAATKFMKMIDPGSVVRESELGMALQAQGVFDRMGNYFHQLEIGKNLTPEQVKDFELTAKKIYDASAEGQKQLDSEYTRQAKQWGVNPTHVVRDYLYKEPKKPSNAAPVKIANDAEYNSLPSGASYIAPDGSIRSKK